MLTTLIKALVAVILLPFALLIILKLLVVVAGVAYIATAPL